MRELTEDEATKVFAKLAKYIGANTKYLLERTDEKWVFRLLRQRVWYMSKRLADRAATLPRDHIRGAGVCIGKFTHHGNFRVTITALDFIAQYAQYKVWVKPNQEQSFLYGNHVTRAGLGRITQGTPKHQGVVVLNMADVPLGFGVTAFSTAGCHSAESAATVLFHEADIAEYIRNEAHLLM
eukprot:RCo009662